MNEGPQQEQPEITYELKSAKEAADMLRISESTVWRYAAQDVLPSYRVGRKRVMFRRSDVEALVNRVRGRKQTPMARAESLRLVAMTTGASTGGAGTVGRANALREEILARRGGAALSASWEDIDEARKERSADL